MSECNYWWRTGDIQWCDMKGNDCTCAGWEEHCDMRKSGRRKMDLESELSEEEVTLASKKRTKHRRAA